MSYAMQKGEHVRVDFLYARLPAHWQSAVDLVTDFLVIGVSVTIVVLSLPYVQQSYGILEGSPDPGGLPYRWVLKAFIPLGFGLLGLQAISQALGALTTFAAARDERTVPQ
jgi:TRAP-type mannitol/chloroaromatic compound transport system permease small subunit